MLLQLFSSNKAGKASGAFIERRKQGLTPEQAVEKEEGIVREFET